MAEHPKGLQVSSSTVFQECLVDNSSFSFSRLFSLLVIHVFLASHTYGEIRSNGEGLVSVVISGTRGVFMEILQLPQMRAHRSNQVHST